MTGVYESPKPRVNTSMLSQYISRPVCLLGRLEKVLPSGSSFTLKDGEGKTASVELNDPLDEELSGIVEVIGMVSNKGTVMAVSYTHYREDKVPFDLELYNEALKVLHDYPQYYPFEVVERVYSGDAERYIDICHSASTVDRSDSVLEFDQ